MIAKGLGHNFAFLTFFCLTSNFCTKVWDGSFHLQIPAWTRRFGFCGAALGSDEKEWVSFWKQGLFDQHLEWGAAGIDPLSWFPSQAWLAIKTLETVWSWSLNLYDSVTSNPGSENVPLQSVHTQCVSSQTGSVVVVRWAVALLTSCRFTETAAALWANSSCSRTTSRSTVSL